MKNLLTVVLVLMLSVTYAVGQITFSTDTLMKVSDDLAENPVDIGLVIQNAGSTDVEGFWKRFGDTGPFETQICENGVCWFTTVDTGNIIIPAGDTTSLLVGFLVDSTTEAEGLINIRLHFGRDVDTVTFKLVRENLPTISSIREKSLNDNGIMVYPNPARDYVLVKREFGNDVARVEVYNMLGVKVMNQHVDADNMITRVDLLDLQKGIYMVRVFDKDNSVVMTKSISKVR